MTKKQAYKIIEKKYGKYDGSWENEIEALCISLPKKLKYQFWRYWDFINTKEHSYIFQAFSDYESSIEEKSTLVSLTRLIILHHFIEDTYE